MKKSLVIFGIGVLMIVSATFVLLQQGASAALTNYSYVWTVTQWRNISSGNFGQSTITIGPAQWTVNGTVGAASYSETWTAETWEEGTSSNAAFFCGGASNITRFTTGAKAAFVATGTNTGTPSSNPYTLASSGQYGASCLTNHAVSMPSSWRVQGTITTP